MDTACLWQVCCNQILHQGGHYCSCHGFSLDRKLSSRKGLSFFPYFYNHVCEHQSAIPRDKTLKPSSLQRTGRQQDSPAVTLCRVLSPKPVILSSRPPNFKPSHPNPNSNSRNLKPSCVLLFRPRCSFLSLFSTIKFLLPGFGPTSTTWRTQPSGARRLRIPGTPSTSPELLGWVWDSGILSVWGCRLLSRRVPVLKLGSRGPGGDARSLRCVRKASAKRPQSVRKASAIVRNRSQAFAKRSRRVGHAGETNDTKIIPKRRTVVTFGLAAGERKGERREEKREKRGDRTEEKRRDKRREKRGERRGERG